MGAAALPRSWRDAEVVDLGNQKTHASFRMPVSSMQMQAVYRYREPCKVRCMRAAATARHAQVSTTGTIASTPRPLMPPAIAHAQAQSLQRTCPRLEVLQVKHLEQLSTLAVRLHGTCGLPRSSRRYVYVYVYVYVYAWGRCRT